MAWFAAAAPYITAATGVVAAAQTIQQGRIIEAQSEIDAAAEGDRARTSAIEKRKDLLRALSAQSLRAGAQGVAFEGSVAAIAERDIEESRNDLLIDDANSRARQRALKNRGKNARTAANVQAGASLLDTATKTSKLI